MDTKNDHICTLHKIQPYMHYDGIHLHAELSLADQASTVQTYKLS